LGQAPSPSGSFDSICFYALKISMDGALTFPA
jgi:hypothetical protein